MDKARIEGLAKVVKKEVGQETAVYVYGERKFPKDFPEFVMLFQAAGMHLFKVLSPGACKVLGYMFSMMQFSNHIGIDQKSISEELDLSLRTVNGAIKELEVRNVIISYKDPQDTRRKVYMVNGHAAWKGKAFKLKKHLKDNPNQLDFKNLFPIKTEAN
jgi:hypothetical protein